MEEILQPTDHISGFDIRPGYYLMNGATQVRGGVNFTIHSFYATSVTLKGNSKSLMRKYHFHNNTR